MALECAHCGARCDDDAARCPKCLRTQLVAIPAAPAPKKGMPGVVIAIFALVGLTATFAVLHSRSRPPGGATQGVPTGAPEGAADPLATGPELAPLVARLRGNRDPVARARDAAEAITRRRQAALITEDDIVPPPRAPDLAWRILPVARERVTELDLARLIAGALRAAGDGGAQVVERLSGPRPDEPADPTGALGSYAVRVGEHVVDVASGAILPQRDVSHRALDAAALAGAVSAQAALEMATGGVSRDRAVQYATAAVQGTRDAPTALAARARVWIEAGGSGGLPLAEADLQAATSQRDDPSLHLARARLLVIQGRVDEAARAALRASGRAPGWGTAALAVIALRDVIAALDAGAADGCAGLRASRAPWTDDAYALCAEGVTPEVKAQAARRLLDASRDPLRVAWAAAALGEAPGLRDRVRASQRGELARWLVLLRRPELAAQVLGEADAGR